MNYLVKIHFSTFLLVKMLGWLIIYRVDDYDSVYFKESPRSIYN